MTEQIWEGQRAHGNDKCKVCGMTASWSHYDTHEQWHREIDNLAAVVSRLLAKDEAR